MKLPTAYTEVTNAGSLLVALQDVELMLKHEDFGYQRSPRPEQPDQGAPNQSAKFAHRPNYRPIRCRQSAIFGFAVGTVALG
jgi:hypothetical protein